MTQIDCSKNPLILYDGVCALCNGWVKFVLKRDRKALFKFGALQSRSAQEILNPHHINPEMLTSVVLIDQTGVYTKSNAVLKVLLKLGWPWKLAAVLFVVPRFLRDYAYDHIARLRYRVFGKYETCPLIPSELRERFLQN